MSKKQTFTKEELIKIIEQLEKDPNDRVGILSDIGITTLGAVGGGAAAAILGSTTASIPIITALTGIGIAVAAPVAFVAGAAVAGGAAVYGVSRLIKDGGFNEGKRKELLRQYQEILRDIETKERQSKVNENDKIKLYSFLKEPLKYDLISPEDAYKLIEAVESGQISLTEAYKLLTDLVAGIKPKNIQTTQAKETPKVVITCPSCSQKLRTPSNLGKLNLTCPKCKHYWSWVPNLEIMNTLEVEKANKLLKTLQDKLLKAHKEKFTFLLVGRTGVGKSSTVNSLMGKEIAPVGDYEPTTMQVKEYDSEIDDIHFKVIDTPGLCDDLEEIENDYKYLELIRTQVKQVDSMWFVSRLDETRVTGDEKRGIKLISEAFGKEVWENSVIIFTFANSVKPEKYSEALQKRTELIRQVISKYTDNHIAVNIPSVAIDNQDERTPDGEKWLGELYTKVFTRISQKGALPFFLATSSFVKPQRIKQTETRREKAEKSSDYSSSYSNPDDSYSHQDSRNNHHSSNSSNYSNHDDSYRHQDSRNNHHSSNSSNYSNPNDSYRYISPRIELNERQKAEIKKTIDAKIIPGCAAVGAAIGAVFGGPTGAAIGGAVGGVIGACAWFFK